MFSSVMCVLLICAQEGLSRSTPIYEISKFRSRVEGCIIVEQTSSEANQTTLQLARPDKPFSLHQTNQSKTNIKMPILDTGQSPNHTQKVPTLPLYIKKQYCNKLTMYEALWPNNIFPPNGKVFIVASQLNTKPPYSTF